jgi:hypothetical protein
MHKDDYLLNNQSHYINDKNVGFKYSVSTYLALQITQLCAVVTSLNYHR